jgi:hypothetical protein
VCPGSAKGGSLETHTDSSRQQPSLKTERWQGNIPLRVSFLEYYIEIIINYFYRLTSFSPSNSVIVAGYSATFVFFLMNF